MNMPRLNQLLLHVQEKYISLETVLLKSILLFFGPNALMLGIILHDLFCISFSIFTFSEFD